MSRLVRRIIRNRPKLGEGRRRDAPPAFPPCPARRAYNFDLSTMSVMGPARTLALEHHVGVVRKALELAHDPVEAVVGLVEIGIVHLGGVAEHHALDALRPCG